MSKARDLATVASRSADLKAGTTAFFAMSSPPTGWLKANGEAVSRTTYAALFTAIGTTFGAGDGSTTFTLPDLRGEFPRGLDDGRGVDTGRGLGSAQAEDTKSHSHNTLRNTPGGGSVSSFVHIDSSSLSTGTTVANTNLPTTNTGGTETRPRNVALLACIKT